MTDPACLEDITEENITNFEDAVLKQDKYAHKIIVPTVVRNTVYLNMFSFFGSL